MTLSEYDAYITAMDDTEHRISDDKYPVVKDSEIKQCCKFSLELSRLIATYLKSNINATGTKTKHKDE